MDAQKLLAELFESGQKLALQGLQKGGEIAASGQELAQQGINYVSEQLPPPGPERDALMTKLGIGAAAAGLVGVLVGTRSGRKVLSPLLKIGSVAALGGLAYKLYSDYQTKNDRTVERAAVESLSDEAANRRSLLLIRTLISAAKSDGTIDEAESRLISDSLKEAGMEQDATTFLMDEMQKPIDVAQLAAESADPQAATEMYLCSLMVTGEPSTKEREYLDRLASALGLDREYAIQLESKALGQV